MNYDNVHARMTRQGNIKRDVSLYVRWTGYEVVDQVTNTKFKHNACQAKTVPVSHNSGRMNRKCSNMRKMSRFRSPCACAMYHPGLCSPFIHSVVSNNSLWTVKALIRLHGCTGWSGPLLSAYAQRGFRIAQPICKTHRPWPESKIVCKEHKIWIPYLPYLFRQTGLSKQCRPTGQEIRGVSM